MTDMPPFEGIVVYGTGGHGRETALLVDTIARTSGGAPLAGYVDDDTAQHRRDIGGVTVLGDDTFLRENAGHFAVALGVGNPRTRKQIVERIRPWVREFPILIHPSVPRFDRVAIAEGTQLHAGTILTTDIKLGAFVILNRHVDISHDCELGDFATLAPAVTLTGAVILGEGTDLGARATVLPGLRVGEWSRVGAGAVVTRDVAASATVVGVPARQRPPRAS
jgi:sugar O-acyltransferase (sialic acid O-acetyltransferase NeuD family)